MKTEYVIIDISQRVKHSLLQYEILFIYQRLIPNDTLKLNEIFLVMCDEMSMFFDELMAMFDKYGSHFNKP